MTKPLTSKLPWDMNNTWEIDASKSERGYTASGIQYFLDQLGTTEQVVLTLRPGIWTVDADYDWSAYTNITFKIIRGALIYHGAYTLNIPNPDAGPYQWLIGTGAVTFSGFTPEVMSSWTGFSPSAAAASNTDALRKIVVAAAGTPYAINSIVAGQIMTGTAPTVILEPGKYEINDNIPFSYLTRIQGSNNTIIHQTDPTKDIFWSESPYSNSFKGMTLIGGKTQIYIMNGAPGVGGMESVHVETECEHYASSDYAFQALFSGVSGGMQVKLGGKFVNCKKAFKTTIDNVSILPNTWIGSYSDDYWDNDTAQIYNASGSMVFHNVVFVPGGTYNVATDFRRWIDNHGYRLILDSCRFGAEGAGVPLIYNYTDMLGLPETYPFLDGGSIIIRNCQTSSGGSSKLDTGLIVAKSGLPASIVIDGNYYTIGSPLIRCNLMDDDVTLASYLASIDSAHQPTMTVNISGNGFIGTTITESAANDLLLRPWTIADIAYYDAADTAYGYLRGNQNIFGNVIATNITGENFFGKSYSTTSISPASPNDTIAIIDTGIPITTIGAFFLVLAGDQNPEGSSAYRQVISGLVIVNYGASGLETYFQPIANTVATGIDALTVTPSIVSSTLRISIGNYLAGNAGAYQSAKLFRLL